MYCCTLVPNTRYYQITREKRQLLGPFGTNFGADFLENAQSANAEQCSTSNESMKRSRRIFLQKNT